MMRLDAMRIRAVARKEMRDYRRKRSIVVTMVVLPLIFLIEPIVSIFFAPGSSYSSDHGKYVILALLYMLLIPVIMPATLAAYTVVGEREQGTLEPLLTTPIRTLELVLGKAAAVMIPSVALSYTVFGLFLVAVRLFANSAVASTVFHQGPVLLVLFLYAPLLAGWAILVGMAISVRASEVRVAQQLGTLASFPPLGVIILLAIGVIHPTFVVAVLFAVGLLVIDVLALRIVSGTFDRERLVTGVKALTLRPTRGSPQLGNSTPGHPVSKGEGVTITTATLKLSRRWGGVIDRNREWQIVMDGNVEGSIASQNKVELPVEPGRHTLRLSSDRHFSPERYFEVADGQVVSFWCRGAMVWPMYVAALIKPDLWISLRQD